MALELNITNEQKQRVTITPLSAAGKPALIDGIPTWTVSAGDSTVDVAADGLSAFLVSSENPGDTVVLVQADADLGAGIETIADTINLHVAGARAANLGLASEAPVAK
jgi:hypothetical protein